ncbi:MAG: ABC transporter permease [Corynebacterium sp.]|uniref:ABC transporter permease n=1 Tax=Corynebacterium sp. TaxID=1720 RepID=UPI0026DCE391|nr:ABC transporter permease [Corynebacterium sp.]MDO4761748.1 ABC transporter permease [Corynebacterium sp.]
MNTFTNALRSETIKLTSLRSTWIYAILLTGTLYGPLVLIGLLTNSEEAITLKDLTSGAPIFAIVTVAFIGASIAGTIEERMHIHAFLTQPTRHLWLIARIVVSTIFIALNFIIGFALALLATTILVDNPYDFSSTADLNINLLFILIAGVLAGGLAVVSRSKILAIVIPISLVLIISQLIQIAASQISALIPLWLIDPFSRAPQLFTQTPEAGWGFGQTQPLLFNLAIITAWIVVPVWAAFAVNARRDVG